MGIEYIVVYFLECLFGEQLVYFTDPKAHRFSRMVEKWSDLLVKLILMIDLHYKYLYLVACAEYLSQYRRPLYGHLRICSK